MPGGSLPSNDAAFPEHKVPPPWEAGRQGTPAGSSSRPARRWRSGTGRFGPISFCLVGGVEVSGIARNGPGIMFVQQPEVWEAAIVQDSSSLLRWIPIAKPKEAA